MYLPVNTISLIQPIDQGAIKYLNEILEIDEPTAGK